MWPPCDRAINELFVSILDKLTFCNEIALYDILIYIPFHYWILSSASLDHDTAKIHYNEVIMGAIASQITSLTIGYSAVYSDADQRKHQSSASPALVR